jgi:hypothetical protein
MGKPVKYAIRVSEANLDLITVLNDGVRPLVEEEPTYFLFEVDGPKSTTNHEIKREDDLYDDNGMANAYLKFLL